MLNYSILQKSYVELLEGDNLIITNLSTYLFLHKETLNCGSSFIFSSSVTRTCIMALAGIVVYLLGFSPAHMQLSSFHF